MRTYTVMECLHRFCFDCVSKYLRIGRKDCPRCGVKLPSTRFMRPDAGIDLVLSFVCPPHIRPSKSLCQDNLERRIPLIAERHNAGPLPKIDDLDPFYVHDPSTSPSGLHTPGTPSKRRFPQNKATTPSTTKRGRPPKVPKPETPKEAPAAPPPAPLVHLAPAVIKMAAPLPLKSTAPFPQTTPNTSTPPPLTSSGGLPLNNLQKNDFNAKLEADLAEKPMTTSTPLISNETSSFASNASQTTSQTSKPLATISTSTHTHNSTNDNQKNGHVVAAPTNLSKTVATGSQTPSTATSANPKRPRRVVGEQLLITLRPNSHSKGPIANLHKPFIIAPTTATVEQICHLINATLHVEGALEVSWKLSIVDSGADALDKNISLDALNRQHFSPLHKDIILYYYSD